MRADDVAVHDAGRIINPLLAAGQVHGGQAQGEHHAGLYPGHSRNAVTPEPSGRQRRWRVAHVGLKKYSPP